MLEDKGVDLIGRKMTKNKEYYISEPEAAVDATVIWLHGLGADANDFMGITDQLGLADTHGVRFIFPNAPYLEVTVNQGYKMRAWYDIYDVNLLNREDESGIKQSQQRLEQIIQHELDQGIDSKRIILAGFSQGGAMSLYTGLRHERPLGGIMVLSAYLPLAANFSAEQFINNRKVPIFMAHGLFDPIVPFSVGQATCKQLQTENYAVEWKTYPMEHTVSMDEIHDIGNFVNRCLGYA